MFKASDPALNAREKMSAALAGLNARVRLNEDERAAINALAGVIERAMPPARLGESHKTIGLIVSGWACEQRVLADGRRQICSFLLPGDVFMVPCKNAVASRSAASTSSVAALTVVDYVDISPVLDDATGPISGLLDVVTKERDERLLDHVVRLGRQSAYQRMAHLLLELRDRLDVIGHVYSNSFRLPLTQEILADTLGLSIVHVNRTVRQLRQEGMIELKAGGVSLLKPKGLGAAAGLNSFEAAASHVDGASAAPAMVSPSVLQPTYDFN